LCDVVHLRPELFVDEDSSRAVGFQPGVAGVQLVGLALPTSGGERKTLRLVARYADGCNLLAPAPTTSRTS
jgi:hypothetical protein